jgi:hypothetical protein
MKYVILLFKIPTGTWKNFFQITDNLGTCPQKHFTSPGPGYGVDDTHFDFQQVQELFLFSFVSIFRVLQKREGGSVKTQMSRYPIYWVDCDMFRPFLAIFRS